MGDNQVNRRNTPAYIAWGALVALTALAALCPVKAWPSDKLEPYLSAGKTVGGGYDPVGAVTLGLRGPKYDVSVTNIAEAPLYGGTALSPRITMLTLARQWTWQDHTFLWGHPVAMMGVSVKKADRCDHQGEADCDRRMPLPWAFHFGLGLEWSQFRIQLFHDSNDCMDYGSEKKNQGVNWLSLQYRVR